MNGANRKFNTWRRLRKTFSTPAEVMKPLRVHLEARFCVCLPVKVDASMSVFILCVCVCAYVCNY